jgi:hypothetical protein
MVSHVSGGCCLPSPAQPPPLSSTRRGQGWIELEGAHSACLTEEGKRLIAREAH